MTKVKHLIETLKNQPHDERLDTARNRSSWTALISLFATYIGVAAGYGIADVPIPGTLQLIFYVPLVTFFVMNMKQEGFQFALPWIKESEQTLDQPAIIRSVPWLYAVTGILAAVTNLLVNPITVVTHATAPVELYIGAAIAAVVYCVVGIVLDIYIANRLKRGDGLFLGLVKWISLLLGLVALSYVVPALLSPDSVANLPGEPLATQGADLFFMLSYLFQFYVIAKHGKRMHEDGKSFEQLPQFNPKKERTVRNWVLFIIFGLPIVAIIIALGLRETGVGESIRDYIGAHPEFFASPTPQ